MSNKKAKIAIVGAGVAGASTALYFGQLGVDITLFEQESSLVSGPPFCHLHAGGNLYREISDAQCITLLKQSIDFLRFYPYIVDYRPTVIVLPKEDKYTPQDLLPRLKLLQKEYELLIKKERKNQVLGKSEHYYKIYDKAQIEYLKAQSPKKLPQSDDEWMIAVAQNIDLDKVQFPLIMVQEYGLNLFRLASGIALSLETLASVTLHTQTLVHDISQEKHSKRWNVSYTKDRQKHTESFDYLINAGGFRSGKIDDMLGTPCKTMVEFKAAYISRCTQYNDIRIPEIIFHGERGTPRGMGQFTPYPHGYFQLHGMTKEITLYEDGLVANTEQSCQPKLGQDFIEKIENAWSKEETTERTNAAIKHLSQFIPSFNQATVGSKPLFGAQQIPGDDPTLRVAEVSFPKERYARCEIVKVSSVLDMIDSIAKEFIALQYISSHALGQRLFSPAIAIDPHTLSKNAKSIAISREYPSELACRTMPTHL